MKLILAVLLLMLCFNNINAQQTHWIYKPNQSVIEKDYFGNAVEDSSSNIFTIYYHHIGINYFKTKIYKLNKYGQLLSIKNNLTKDSSVCIKKLYVLPNQNLLALGVCGGDTVSKYDSLCFIELNNSLQVLNIKKYPLPLIHSSPGNWVLNFNIVHTLQNTYLYVLTFNKPSGGYVSLASNYFCELDMEGNLLREKSYNSLANPSKKWFVSALQNPNNRNINIATRYFHPDGVLYSYMFKYNYTTFQLIDSTIIESGVPEIHPNSEIKVLSNYSYLTTHTPYYSIPIAKRTLKKDSLLNQKFLQYLTPETVLTEKNYVIPIHKSIDFINPNKIFVGVNCILGPAYYYIKGVKSFMGCALLDSSLNIKWSRYIGGELSYQVISILATKDGGALLLGSFDKNLDTSKVTINFLDALMIKIGPNGEVLNTNELPKGIQVLNYLVGNNPVQNNLQITGYSPNTTIHLVNSLGQVVLQQPITEQHTQLNLSHLSAGVYFYRFSSPSGFILQSGKLVKE